MSAHAPKHVSARGDRPGQGHGHGHAHGGRPPKIDGTTAILLAIVIPIGVLALLGMILLWPSGDGPQDSRFDTTYGDPGSTVIEGTIATLDVYACPNPYEGPDGVDFTCARSTVELDSGPQAGRTVEVDLPPASDRAGAAPGDRIRMIHAAVGPEDDQTDYYGFVDFIRTVPMGWLALAYAVVVVAVARLRGLRALIGLVAAFAVVAVFMLPSLLEGKSPLLIGLVGATVIMMVVLYFTHGLSARTTTALLGTLGGLAVTASLGAWATSTSRLTGTASEEGGLLLLSVGSLNLSAILLCGIILAGLGVLNDVTITQASAVWELHALAPHMPARKLFAGAMQIGRDHIASTVYTIAFAYVGAALPILLLLQVYQRPFLAAITSGELAEEVIRTLVGSIGLVLAIPLTTVIAVGVVKAAATRRSGVPA